MALSAAPWGTVEKGDRHRAEEFRGGFIVDRGSEPVPFFHSMALSAAYRSQSLFIASPIASPIRKYVSALQFQW